MRAIVVDDEPKAIDLIRQYLEHFNDIELVATFRNGLKALEYVSKEPVDLIFLDINMPHISGISLSKILPDTIKVIFTTAYSQYAVESYEIQAVDYLIKPISLERFTKSISRIIGEDKSSKNYGNECIWVRSGYENFQVRPDQILFLKKDGNYMLYQCRDRQILARESVHDALQKLPSDFIQVHKSYIVNIKNITSFDNIDVNIGQEKIPISETHKEKLLNLFKSK